MAYMTGFERLGMLEGQRATLLRMIRARFGSVPEALESRIATADRETLDGLTDRVGTASTLDDLLADSE